MEKTSAYLFFTQAVLLLIVVCAAVYNLTVKPDSQMWTTLLGSCLGYMLPNPKLKKKDG